MKDLLKKCNPTNLAQKNTKIRGESLQEGFLKKLQLSFQEHLSQKQELQIYMFDLLKISFLKHTGGDESRYSWHSETSRPHAEP